MGHAQARVRHEQYFQVKIMGRIQSQFLTLVSQCSNKIVMVAKKFTLYQQTDESKYLTKKIFPLLSFVLIGTYN